MDFKKFSFVTFPDCIIYEDHPKHQKYRCLNAIFKSIYNQTRKEEDKSGDLVYLDIYTLEGQTTNDKIINQNPEGPEETPIIGLIIKDLSDTYIKYDVINI
jgi:hypothetical protein